LPLPRKQASEQADWLRVLAELKATADPDVAWKMVHEAADRVRERLPDLGGNPAFGWSGGKDSQLIRLVAEAAGVTECVLAITDLEYPAFLGWATDNMPAGCSVVSNGWDLGWLAAHPDMLFPDDSATAAKWFSGVQHDGQRRYCRRRKVDVLILGRRKADGNFIGAKGDDYYFDKEGFVRWSPLADWSHEDTLYVLAALDVPQAPCYEWPRGFRVGTGPWPARQWTDSREHGWSEVYSIDPDVVATAAPRIRSAKEYMACVA
jgi:3'-phosphoadenosine 5'-phosphosulfate sulfotransferase (PAPS reductase)/FAD synthetase